MPWLDIELRQACINKSWLSEHLNMNRNLVQTWEIL